MNYSKAGHNLSQVNSSDTDAVLRLFIDSVRKFVDSTKIDTTLRCDSELARIAFGLKQSPTMQRWIPLHDLARSTGRQGFTFSEYLDILNQAGVKGCEAYNLQILRRGHGLYWQIHNGMVYPAGYVTLCKRLTKHAKDFGLYDLFITNGVGRVRDMYLSVAGSVADFETSVLAAWYAGKNNPTISRFALCLLFNRDVRTMRRIERRAGIQVVTNIAHTYDPSLVPLNEQGGLRWDVIVYTDKHGRTAYAFHMSNTYHAPAVRQHNKRGQARKAFHTIEQFAKTERLATACEEGANPPGKLNRTGKLYCETYKGAQASIKNGNANGIHIPMGADDGNTIHWELTRTGKPLTEFWAAANGVASVSTIQSHSIEHSDFVNPF